MTTAKQILELTNTFGAHNYHPLPVVLVKGEGTYVYDIEGKKYMDMLSSYSAVNQGHRHPAIIKALNEQASKLTLTSRAFHNDQLGPFLKELCQYTEMEMALPMNTGAEAVETAIKAARKWGYQNKKIAKDKAKIIVCKNNFHGRTTTVISFSSEAAYKEGFGPLTPGFEIIDYGCSAAFKEAIDENTVALMIEPIQGEAGILIPPDGYLEEAAKLCRENNILFILDEIQTGFCRTGKKFAYQYENCQPDMLILGKALGGGVFPVSAVTSSKEILGVFRPGDHGSTFGGNPLGCAVARASLRVLEEEKLAKRSSELGQYFRQQLTELKSEKVKEIRGKGLLIGVEIKEEHGLARPYCEKLMELGMLCKETHHSVIRFAPPLIVTKEELDWAISQIKEVL